MFSCKDVSEKASDHIDGNLSVVERLKMRLHLFICHDCRQFIKQFKTTIQLSRKLPTPPAKEAEIDEQVKQLLAIRKKAD